LISSIERYSGSHALRGNERKEAYPWIIFMLLAIWNTHEEQFAHVRGRLVCFSNYGSAVMFVVDHELTEEKGWGIVDVENPRKVLWYATRNEDHTYWLYEKDEYIDMTAYQWSDSCEEIDRAIETLEDGGEEWGLNKDDGDSW
jgi:hypothetical protein